MQQSEPKQTLAVFYAVMYFKTENRSYKQHITWGKSFKKKVPIKRYRFRMHTNSVTKSIKEKTGV